MAELLQRSELLPKQRRQVESIQRAGEHLLHLVNDALDLARIESGKLVLEDKVFDLHALLEDVSHLLQALAAAKGLHFSLQRAPATPRAMRGDAVRLRQILLNLGSNAVKFTDHGEVALRGAGTPQGLLLEISDTGPGMEDTQVAKLFQRFEQGDGLHAAKRRAGSGLGLAICQELAQAMGGRIEVQSRPGQGTCLRVRLPIAVADLEELLPEQARRAPRSANSLRVLVVEDDPTVATVVTGLLEFLGHQAVHAPQALAALTELATSRFDIALLDLDLPGLDGFELARIIRTQGHAIALVALTARSDPQSEALAYAAGMHGFLRKPVTSQILREKLDEVLTAYRLTVSGSQPAMA
jgi:CheY-like chemotaxis protein/anti-sigma regulatory factor (Ser/Thr protein kinase)